MEKDQYIQLRLSEKLKIQFKEFLEVANNDSDKKITASSFIRQLLIKEMNKNE